MLTSAARASRQLADLDLGVLSRNQLAQLGINRFKVRDQLAAGRWRMLGRAVVLHTGPLSRQEQWRAALVNCGPRAALTSFTAAEAYGLRGWERAEIHVLVPVGVTPPRLAKLPIVVHRTRHWGVADLHPATAHHRLGPALVVAASGYRTARPACGILAAAVQQRLIRIADLRAAIEVACRTRHRAAMLSAIDDIGMGAHALSEIDFARVCRRNGLPTPVRQAIRTEPNGRRRYLDAEWVRADGQRVVVEVDGAVHLAPRRWFDDQLRQNEIALGGALFLRYPSVVAREEEQLVVTELRRALLLDRDTGRAA